jgi:hypothetical protein
MVHCYADHSSDAAAVEDFNPFCLEGGESPGITSPEDDVDGCSNVNAAADLEGYFVVSKKFIAKEVPHLFEFTLSTHNPSHKLKM